MAYYDNENIYRHVTPTQVVWVSYSPVDRDQLRDELQAAGLNPSDGAKNGFEYRVEFGSPVDPDAVTAVIEAHSADTFDQLDQLLVKARDVWQGNSTFTTAQAQKILAGLVLLAAKHLR